MEYNKPYVLSPYTLLLRDKPNLFARHPQPHATEEALKLEQYLNDLYHHFLYRLTADMQSPELLDETKLRSLFEELLKTKNLLQKID